MSKISSGTSTQICVPKAAAKDEKKKHKNYLFTNFLDKILDMGLLNCVYFSGLIALEHM